MLRAVNQHRFLRYHQITTNGCRVNRKGGVRVVIYSITVAHEGASLGLARHRGQRG